MAAPEPPAPVAAAPAPSRVPVGTLLGCFLLGAWLDVLQGARSLRGVLQGELGDPDSYMRLVRLLEGLRGDGFTSVVQADSGGQGTVIYWSHLLDAAIMLLAAPSLAFLDRGDALRWAGIATGPILVGLLSAAAAWAVAPLAAPGLRWTAALAAAVSPLVAGYGGPGSVSHHVLLGLTCLMAAGWAGRAVSHAADGDGAAARAGGWTGFWAGTGIWVSPEAMPFGLMAFGAIGLAWLLRPPRRRGTPAGAAASRCGAAFLAVIAAALLVDPPHAGRLSPEIDRLSLPYLALAAAVCGGGLVLRLLDGLRLAPSRRAAAGLLATGGAFAAWLASFPSVLRGPAALVPADQARAFFGVIQEMQPVQGIAEAATYLLTGVLAVGAATALAVRGRTLSATAVWLYAALCAGVSVALGALHVRFALYAGVLGALALPAVLTALSPVPFGRLAAFALFLGLPQLAAWQGFFPAAQAAATGPHACSVREAAPALAGYGDAVVLGAVSDAPELLYRTRLRTVGSFYHRGIDAYMRAWAAWRTRPAEGSVAPPEVLATGAEYVLACPGAGRPSLVRDLPPDTLFDRLGRGEAPSWLHREPMLPGGYVLYRIAR